MAFARAAMVSLDCADPVPLAEFWAALLGGEVIIGTEPVCAVRTDNIMIATIQVPEYTPPSWPEGDPPKHMHLDLAVQDLDEAEAEAVRLGATKSEHQPQPDQWRVFQDPAGHPFCLTVNIAF